MRRSFCLILALALLAAPALAIDREELTPRRDLVDRLVAAFLDVWEKAGGCPEPFGLCQPAAPPAQTTGDEQSAPLSAPEPQPETERSNS